MFWKTMAILWTVLLLILAGAAVQFVRTAQPGSSKVEVSLKEPAKGTQATAQPGVSKVEVPPKGPAKGTQATAILSNVRCEEAVLMPALRNLTKTNTTGKSLFSLLLEDLQDKSLKDLHRCLSIRRLEGDMAAIDVHGCKSDHQARDLAYAVAVSYIQFVHELKTKVSKVTIKRLTDERDTLRSQLNRICREIAHIRRAVPTSIVRGQKSVPLIRLENLSREILEARTSLSRAESALKVHEKMQKNGSLADSPEVRMAVETDPILQALKILLVEVKADLQALPPNHDKKSVITVLQGEIKARQKEVLESQIKSIGLERQTSRVAAIERLADLMVRKTTAEVETRDTNKTLSAIDNLESEKNRAEEMLSKIEHRLLEVKMGLLEGMPELIAIFQ